MCAIATAQVTLVDLAYLCGVTAMPAHNLLGTALPLFIILPKDPGEMDKFGELSTSRRSWICSTRNACETTKSFLICMVHCDYCVSACHLRLKSSELGHEKPCSPQTRTPVVPAGET
jgi:hypothetical protein